MACKQHLDCRCVFAIHTPKTSLYSTLNGCRFAGSQRSQPKHVSNPDSVLKKFKPSSIHMIAFQANGEMVKSNHMN